jgi:CheY-like chemotaxis protein
MELEHNPDLHELTQQIIGAVQRASSLTAQLLAFARKGQYRHVPVDIHHVVDEVVTLLRRSIDKRITVDTRLDAQEHVTSGDPAQIQNAVLNLALNARDAMPQGGTLTFATTQQRLEEGDCAASPFDIVPGDYVELAVRDTGTGMSVDVLRRIFEPFFTTKEPGKGTGMGLASVYGTVRNHRGVVTVESAPGEGSTFRLLLPRVSADGAVSEKPHDSTADETGARGHVLIADDEDMVCRTAQAILQRRGFVVTVCRNGQEVLEKYSSLWLEIDCVLLDMVMPVMGGKETFAALRAINPRARVVLVSGFSMGTDVQELLENGAAGFIQKPYTTDELLKGITDAMRLPGRPG